MLIEQKPNASRQNGIACVAPVAAASQSSHLFSTPPGSQ
jgi:hypothetical protein